MTSLLHTIALNGKRLGDCTKADLEEFVAFSKEMAKLGPAADRIIPHKPWEDASPEIQEAFRTWRKGRRA
jgi:hypothetical protein